MAVHAYSRFGAEGSLKDRVDISDAHAPRPVAGEKTRKIALFLYFHALSAGRIRAKNSELLFVNSTGVECIRNSLEDSGRHRKGIF
jgi:hypothetical protein